MPRPESEEEGKGSSDAARLGEEVEEGEGGVEVERGRLRVGTEGFDIFLEIGWTLCRWYVLEGSAR